MEMILTKENNINNWMLIPMQLSQQLLSQGCRHSFVYLQVDMVLRISRPSQGL